MDAPVSRVLMPLWPACACGLPMRGRCAWAWNFGPVTSDLDKMTLTLGFLWMLLCPWYWCHCGQFMHVWTCNEGLMCMGVECQSFDLWPWWDDLDLGILMDAAVSMVLMSPWQICACQLPIRNIYTWAWNFGPVTFDLVEMTLTLEFLWMLLCDTYFKWYFDVL